MRIMDFKSVDVLNGEGTRASIWFAGCNHQCRGCFGKNTWKWDGHDNLIETYDLLGYVEEAMTDTRIVRDGISLLGGDPLYPKNQVALYTFLMWFKRKWPDKTVWLWTGYTHEECLQGHTKRAIMNYVDVLIDGKFEEDKKNLKLKWRGSENQRIINIKEL